MTRTGDSEDVFSTGSTTEGMKRILAVLAVARLGSGTRQGFTCTLPRRNDYQQLNGNEMFISMTGRDNCSHMP